MDLLTLLANDGFICVNKHIIRKLGLQEAVLIGELASIYTYNYNKNALEDDWFYATIDKIKENTGLTEYTQQQVISNLCEMGLLRQKLQGIPRKRFLQFDKQKLLEFTFNKDSFQLPEIREQAPRDQGTSSVNSGNKLPEIKEQAPQNSDTIYNKKYNNKDKNRNNPKERGDSNKNISNNILGKNNQKETMEPRGPLTPRGFTAPEISKEDRIPVKLRYIFLEWRNHPEALNALEDYILFLLDTYNTPVEVIKQKITQIQRMASNVPQGIEIICRYNIDRNYSTPYKPADYKKQMADAPVISQEFTGEFVTDENGLIEEV